MQSRNSLLWEATVYEGQLLEEALQVVKCALKRMKYTREHIGVCHECDKVYIKPKHGTKSQYCCRACGQKAYRKRKKLEKER